MLTGIYGLWGLFGISSFSCIYRRRCFFRLSGFDNVGGQLEFCPRRREHECCGSSDPVLILGATQVRGEDNSGEARVNNRQAVFFPSGRIRYGNARGRLHDADSLALRTAVIIDSRGDAEAIEAGVDEPLNFFVIARHDRR